MQIQGSYNTPVERRTRVRKAEAPSSINATMAVDPSTTVGEPVYEEAEFVAAVRAELERIIRDPSLAPQPGRDADETAAREIGRRLYASYLDHHPMGREANLLEGWRLHLGSRWKMPRTPGEVVVQIRYYEREIRRVVVSLPAELPPCIDGEDVLQESALALLQGLRTYDPYRGALGDWLELSIRNHVRRYAQKFVPISADRQRQIAELVTTTQRLEQKLFREPDDVELCDALAWKPCVLDNVRESIQAKDILSLDTFGLARQLPDSAPLPEEKAWTAERQAKTAALLRALPPTERQFVHLHYAEGQTLDVIGQTLGLSPRQLRYLHQKMLMRLRAQVADVRPPVTRKPVPGVGSRLY